MQRRGSHSFADSFASYERALARYCRMNVAEQVPGVREDRVGTYRSLVFNGVESALRSAYPVTFALLGKEQWLELVNSFFSQHDSAPPQLWKMPYGLFLFVNESRYGEKSGMPYLSELLLFEWVEIEVHMMPDSKRPDFTQHGDLMTDCLALNLDHKLIELTFPVFKMDPREALKHKGRYFLLCYRHQENLKAHYLELSAQYRALFSALLEGATAQEAAIKMKREFNLDDSDNLVRGVPQFMQALWREGVVLGFLSGGKN